MRLYADVCIYEPEYADVVDIAKTHRQHECANHSAVSHVVDQRLTRSQTGTHTDKATDKRTSKLVCACACVCTFVMDVFARVCTSVCVCACVRVCLCPANYFTARPCL